MVNTILTVKELKEFIKDLSDDLPIECSVHELDNTYVINDAYCCINSVHESILQLDIKTDWELTERDELAFRIWCEEQGFDEND